MTTEKAVAKVEPRAVGITKEYAIYLLKTIWPAAPDPEVVKAALICARYGLDPLLKEVSLIKFDKRKWNPQTRQREKVGEDWVAVLGIKANRKIASNHGARRYSYTDGPLEDSRRTHPPDPSRPLDLGGQARQAVFSVLDVQGTR